MRNEFAFKAKLLVARSSFTALQWTDLMQPPKGVKVVPFGKETYEDGDEKNPIRKRIHRGGVKQ